MSAPPVPPAAGEPLDPDEARGRLADALAEGLLAPGDEGAAERARAAACAAGLAPEEAGRLAAAASALERAVALTADEVQALLAAAAGPVDGASEAPPVLPPDYELLGEVGRGGMGIVYRARQRSLDRVVALKVLRPGDLLFAQSLRRFEQEARVLARLRHPHIVSVHEVGSHAGRVYFTMDLVAGRPLTEVLRDGPLTPARAVRLLKQVAAAVACVHAHGLVHRDLKPANILVGPDDHVVVTDFGLALEVGREDGLTLTGQVVGTPGYMSPEQARGDLAAVGEATDVHALGVLLYECLAGRRPFGDRSPAEEVYAVLKEEPPRLRRAAPSAPEALERVAGEAMRKDPAQRYASARALLEDLERFEEGLAVRARAAGRLRRLGREVGREVGRVVGRRRGALALGALAALLLLAAGAWLGEGLGGGGAEAAYDLAERLRARGEVAAALAVYEEAGATRSPEPAPALDRRVARLQEEVAWQHLRAGRAADARALLTASLEASGARYRDHPSRAPRRGPRRWLLALAEAVDGRLDVARDQAQAALRDELDWTPEALHDGVAAGAGASDPAAAARAWIVERLRPGFERRDVPERALARAALRCTPLGLAVRSSDHPLPSSAPPDGVDVAGLIEVHLEAYAAAWSEDPRDRLRGRDVLDAMAPAPLERALRRVLDDPARPARERELAALHLQDRLDLPESVVRTSDVGTVDVPAVQAACARLEALDPEARLAWRLEQGLRLREALFPGDVPEAVRGGLVREELEGWFRARAGAPPGSWAQTLAWWQAHRDERPARRLARALGLSEVPSPGEAPALLREQVRRGRGVSEALDALLGLCAPAPGLLLTPRSVRQQPPALQAWWSARFAAVHGPQRLRVARVRLLPEGPQLDPTLHLEVPLPASGPFTAAVEGRAAPRAQPYLGLSFPPGRTAAVPRTEGLELSLALGDGRGGTALRTTLWLREEGGAGRTLRRASTRDVSASLAQPLGLEPGSWSHPDPYRLELLLAVLEPLDAPAGPWTLADWQARLTADLVAAADQAQAADEREEQRAATRGPGGVINRWLYDHQRDLMVQGLLATRLPLPGAVEALQRLDRLLERGTHLATQRRLLLLARLMAGDATVAQDPARRAAALGRAPGRARLPGEAPPPDAGGEPLPGGWEGDDGYVMTTAGKEGEFWARLLAWSASEPIRTLAREQLEAGPVGERAAGDLRRAAAAGRVVLPEALARRVDEGPTEDTSGWGQVRSLAWAFALAALLLLASLAVLVVWLRRRRHPIRSLRPAAWLIVLGGALGCLRAEAAGLDVLPDDLGLALMGVGALALAWRTTSAAVRAPGVAFLLAAGLLGLGRLLPLPETLAALAPLLAALGVGLLPWLGARLGGVRPDEGRRPPADEASAPPLRHGLALVGLFAVLVALARLTSPRDLGLSLLPWLFLLGLLGGALLLRRLRRAAPALRRALPVPFLLLYVLPVAVASAAWCVAALGGPALRVRLDGAPAALLLLAFGACVVWALLRPLRGAAVRRAYLRLR